MKRVPLLESFSFQPPVIDKDLSDPPGSPTEGERYIVKAVGTGVWAGKDNNIVTYDGSAWIFAVPEEGWFVHVDDEDKFYKFNGTDWEVFATAGAPTYNAVTKCLEFDV